MKKVGTICLFILFFLATCVSVLAYWRFNDIEKRILFIDRQMWDLHPQIMHEPIASDYLLSSYLKDLIIDVELFKYTALVFLVIVFVAALCPFVFGSGKIHTGDRDKQV